MKSGPKTKTLTLSVKGGQASFGNIDPEIEAAHAAAVDMFPRMDYIVARPWVESELGDPRDGKLCIYMMNSQEIQYGTIYDARALLEHVRSRSPKEKWRIYKVTTEELKDD